jgi:serine/threonine protein kinase
VIGSGSFGEVYECNDLQKNNEVVAVKKIMKINDDDKIDVANEVELN